MRSALSLLGLCVLGPVLGLTTSTIPTAYVHSSQDLAVLTAGEAVWEGVTAVSWPAMAHQHPDGPAFPSPGLTNAERIQRRMPLNPPVPKRRSRDLAPRFSGAPKTSTDGAMSFQHCANGFNCPTTGCPVKTLSDVARYGVGPSGLRTVAQLQAVADDCAAYCAVRGSLNFGLTDLPSGIWCMCRLIPLAEAPCNTLYNNWALYAVPG